MHLVSLYCPACGKVLVVPTTDRRSIFQCPRCGKEHITEELVAQAKPADPGAVDRPSNAPPQALEAPPQAFSPRQPAGSATEVGLSDGQSPSTGYPSFVDAWPDARTSGGDARGANLAAPAPPQQTPSEAAGAPMPPRSPIVSMTEVGVQPPKRPPASSEPWAPAAPQPSSPAEAPWPDARESAGDVRPSPAAYSFASSPGMEAPIADGLAPEDQFASGSGFASGGGYEAEARAGAGAAPAYASAPAYAPAPAGAPGAASAGTPGAAPAAGAAGGAWAHAIKAGAQGTRHIGRFGEALLALSDRVDRALYGRRAAVVGAGAAVTVACSVLEAWLHPEAPFFTALLTWALVSLLLALAFARLGSLRDDEGSWSLDLARRRAAELLVDLRASLTAWRALTSASRWQVIGKALLFVGFLLLAFRTVAVLFSITLDELFGARVELVSATDHALLVGGAAVAIAGLACFLVGFQKLRREAAAQRLRPDAEEQARIREAAFALPAVLDCADAAHVQEVARRAGHPVLEQLLELLADWRPRRRDYEDEYQASLYRFIHQRMPGANPQRELPVGRRAEGTAGRADLVVSASVLIEMKRGCTTSTAQKALGQIQMYLRAWDKGPVILLLCDADAGAAQRFLAQEIADLRARAPVMLVLAARPSP